MTCGAAEIICAAARLLFDTLNPNRAIRLIRAAWPDLSGRLLAGPYPGRRLGLVGTVLVRVVAAFNLLVQEAILGMSADLL